MNRLALGNLIESMDYCDATRSHEALPSIRIKRDLQDRRYARALWSAVVVIVALVWLAGAVSV